MDYSRSSILKQETNKKESHYRATSSTSSPEVGALANLTKLKNDDDFLAPVVSSSQELQPFGSSKKEEIQSLRKQITYAYTRELQLRNEKLALEKKFSELRMAIDERQNEAVRTALNELDSRKRYHGDNLKLMHELKVVEGELYVYVSSILGLLTEYNVCPPVANASAICHSLKQIHDELQWKITVSNENIRKITSALESHPRSHHFDGNKNGVDIVSSQNPLENMNAGLSRTPSTPLDVIERIGSSIDNRMVQQSSNPEFTFNPERHGSEADGERFGNAIITGSTSYEEIPGIEDFQIIGNPTPGEKLLGCGYPVCGTSLCMFQWVRHLEDGTREYIEGARNPEYVVTPDDVGKLIEIECIPLDNQDRQGELVKLFANNQRKIQCDPEMEQAIDQYVSVGNASFDIYLLTDASDGWEPANLALQRSNFQIKRKKDDALVLAESFSNELLSIKIPLGLSTQVVLMCSDASYPLSANSVRERDILVLTMRHFQRKALDYKGKNIAWI